MAPPVEQRLRSRALLIELMADRLTTRALASRASCSPAMISHLRTGVSQGCSTDLAGRLAEALGVRMDVLFRSLSSENSERSSGVANGT